MERLALVAMRSLAHSLSFPDSEEKDLGLSSPPDCSVGQGDRIILGLSGYSEIDDRKPLFCRVPLPLGEGPREW